MKTFTLTCAMLLLSSIGLFAQSGMTINSGGAVTVNGNLTITPAGFACGNSFTDSRDGKTYNTVLIGNQCWIAQNLNVGKNMLVPIGNQITVLLKSTVTMIMKIIATRMEACTSGLK